MFYWESQRGVKQSNPERPNRRSLLFVKRALDVFSDRVYPDEFYIQKLEFAHRRYEAFKLVNTLVKAYRYRGEAQWFALRAIFERSGQADDDSDEESLPNLWYDNDSDSNAHISDCVFLGIGSPKNDAVAPPEEEVIDLISNDDDSGPE
ncbi:hypothetical protein Salat_0225400 [Sesamum alatum]|uniref:Uncharacterized protein n=1 Tax=Sesamum alatum TaxID=300844 RepID=A0AAE1YZT2_9LAMI|nr:hypothetical protein Salat_0225400 [Sesamum alatum]